MMCFTFYDHVLGSPECVAPTYLCGYRSDALCAELFTAPRLTYATQIRNDMRQDSER